MKTTWPRWHSTHPVEIRANDDYTQYSNPLWDYTPEGKFRVIAFGNDLKHSLGPDDPIYRIVFELELPHYSENSYANGDLEFRDEKGFLISDDTLLKDVKGQCLWIGWPAGVGG